MRVHHDTLVDVECVAKDDIGGLSPYACESYKLGHGLGDLTIVVFDECPAGILDALGFVTKKPDTADVVLQFFQRYSGVVGGLAIFFEQILRDDVYLFISALCGKDRGDH